MAQENWWLCETYDRKKVYVSRKEGGKWLVGIEDWVDSSIKRLEQFIKTSKKIITVSLNAVDMAPWDETEKKTPRKLKWKRKQFYGYL